MQHTQGRIQTSILNYFKRNSLNLTNSSSLTNVSQTSEHQTKRCSSTSDLRMKKRNNCYNKKCPFCPILDKTGNITCTTTGTTFDTKYNISCKSSNLIYCITCQTCLKQYVGQTKNSIAQRFYAHFHNVRHHKTTDGVGMHFSRSDHHGTRDFKISVLEFIKLPPQSEAAKNLRLKIEKNWIHKLRTPAPLGLNIFD